MTRTHVRGLTTIVEDLTRCWVEGPVNFAQDGIYFLLLFLLYRLQFDGHSTQ